MKNDLFVLFSKAKQFGWTWRPVIISSACGDTAEAWMRYQQKITTRMSTTKHVILSVSSLYFHKNAYARYAFKFGFLFCVGHGSIKFLNLSNFSIKKNLGIIVAGMLGLLLNEIWACGGYYVFKISSYIITDKFNLRKSLNIDLYTWKKY